MSAMNTYDLDLKPHPNAYLSLGIRIRFPVKSNQDEYCVGGALYRHFYGRGTFNFPFTPMMAALLLRANPALKDRRYVGKFNVNPRYVNERRQPVCMADVFAKGIQLANDFGTIELAWTLLDEALTWEPIDA